MSSNRWWCGFGKWQRNTNDKHPLVFQCFVNIISAIVIAFIFWLLAKTNLLYKTMSNAVRITDSYSQVTIKNEGILPSNDVYEIATGDVVGVRPIIKLGTPFISDIESVANNKYRIYLKDLPANQKVIFNLDTGKVSVKKE